MDMMGCGDGDVRGGGRGMGEWIVAVGEMER